MENKTPAQQPEAVKEKRPDDTGTVNLTGFIKIFDPKTRKVFVEQKA